VLQIFYSLICSYSLYIPTMVSPSCSPNHSFDLPPFFPWDLHKSPLSLQP
jgi:hypothetical protein